MALQQLGPAGGLGEYPYFEDVNEGIVRCLPEVKSLPGATRVLDLGCGHGRLGAELRKRGYEVFGVEREPAIVQRASEHLNKVITGDLQAPQTILSQFKGMCFDYIIFSDVLEHMVSPLEILSSYLPLLASDGKVVISVPNVANWQTRLALSAGRFTYKATGVLDRTHLRFFTRRSLAALIRSAGLTVVKEDVTPMLSRVILPMVKTVLRRKSDGASNPGVILQSPLYSYYMRWVNPVETRIARVCPGLFAFRLIVVAAK